jgi:hypothetical protein
MSKKGGGGGSGGPIAVGAVASSSSTLTAAESKLQARASSRLIKKGKTTAGRVVDEYTRKIVRKARLASLENDNFVYERAPPRCPSLPITRPHAALY